MPSPHAEVLAAALAPEPFVRRALSVWLADLRELALLALADWERTEIVSAELFTAVAGLQRPSFGSWNGLLGALRNARKTVLRTGTPQDRERVERARLLAALIAALDEPLPAEAAQAAKPLAELTRSQLRSKPRVADALPLPIALRNRVEHDLPEDPAWWERAANALRPLVEWRARGGALDAAIEGAERPAPWFEKDGETVLAMNGLASDFSAILVSRDGKSRHSEGASGAVVRSLQRLLGKADAQERDVKAFLARVAPEELRGVLLGDFLVGKPVGSGGFATVHGARQLSTGRRVALKILHDGMPEEVRARFRQEVEFLSRFDHPNIVGVVASGEETWSAPRAFSLASEDWWREFSRSNVKTFIALDWIDGTTLEEAMKSERPLRERARWLHEAAGALAAVHAAGLVHRDVKPSNLMLRADGSVVLMDFGIARSHGEARTLVTTTGHSLGTPAYMSPEQLRAADAEVEVGPATDIYSLCATFYEVLTGDRLYGHDKDGGATGKTSKLAGVRPERPRRLVTGMPWELDVILMGGLEPEVADRYASMEALARDAGRFLRDEPIEYRRPSLWRRARLGYRRNRAVANVVGLSVAVIASGTGVYLRSLDEARKAAEASAAREKIAKDDALVERDKARFEQLRSEVAAVEATLGELWTQRDLASVPRARIARATARVCSTSLALSKRVAPEANPEKADLEGRLADVRDSAHVLAAHTAGELAVVRRFGHRGAARGGVFSPDGQWIAAGLGAIVGVWERASGRLLGAFHGHTGAVTACAFSPDGGVVLTASSDRTLRLWERASGRLLLTLEGHSGEVSACAFSPDGREVLSASADRTLRLWDRATGRLSRTFEGHSGGVKACAFSPDGAEILSASEDRTLRRWDRASGRLLATLEGHGGAVLCCAFSPDGKNVLSGSRDDTLRLCDRSSGRLVATFEGHASGIASCTFSPDGREILSASGDDTLRLWDPASGRLLGTFAGHSSTVWSGAFSPDGREVLSASEDGTVRLWDRASGRQLRVSECDTSVVTCCAFSPDGREILSGSWDRMLRLWDRATGRLVRTFLGPAKTILACAFSPDGASVLAASEDGTLRLWDRASGRLLATFEGHTDQVTCCAFSPDGGQVLSGSRDRTLRLWEASSGRLVRTFEGHTDHVTCCAFSPDGREVLSTSDDKTLRSWEAASGRLVRTFEGHKESPTSCAFSPDGLEVLSTSWDDVVRLWDRASGALVRTFDGPEAGVPFEPEKLMIPETCAFSRDGREVLLASRSHSLRLWNRADGRVLGTYQDGAGQLTSCAVSPDGREVLAASADGMLRLWDRSSGRRVRTFEGHEDPVVSCAFSPDGGEILSGSADDSLRLWDRATGRFLHDYSGLQLQPMTACAFSPDGRQVLSGCEDDDVRLFDRASGKLLKRFPSVPDGNQKDSGVDSCAFSPDGREFLTTCSDGAVRIWDASGKLLSTLKGHTKAVTCGVYSSNGREVLSASSDGTLRLWDRASGRVIRTFEGHSGAVWCCAFSPDGRRILSASADRTLKLWDAATGRALRTFEGPTGSVRGCAFSGDGRELVSASGDKKLRLWDRSSGRIVATLEGHTGEIMAAAYSPEGREVLSASSDKTLALWDRGVPADVEAALRDDEALAGAEQVITALVLQGRVKLELDLVEVTPR
jgi:WD40 repeat protein/serine/threonine protein kinase